MNNTTSIILVVLCYIFVSAIKTTKLNSKWYPLISCLFGAAVSLLLFYVQPEILGAETIQTAIWSGMTVGLAATGVNQVFLQQIKAAKSDAQSLTDILTDTNKKE